MPVLRRSRVLGRALVLLGAAALLTSCRVDARVDVTVADDGAGRVQVTVGFDDEALGRAGDLKLDDVRAAGWTVTGPQKEPDRDASGLTWIHATKGFTDGVQFSAVMNEVTGANSLFRDFKLNRTTSFAKVTYAVTGTIDPTHGLDTFSDPEVAQLLGGNSLGRPAADALKDAATSSLVFSVELPRSVKGSADRVIGHRAEWDIPFDHAPITVAVRSEQVQSAAWRWAAIAAVLLVLALIAGVMARSRRGPSRGSDRDPRVALPPKSPSGPAAATVRPIGAIGPGPTTRVAAGAERPPNQKRIRVVVLDAMGVLYREADDVTASLIPFVREHRGIDDPQAIRARYVDASLGRHTSAELWSLLGVAGDPSELDRSYVERFALRDGVHQFLDAMDQRDIAVACLTNDVSEWSELLRRRFGLDPRVHPWIVSGDVGARKPDARMFAVLQRALDIPLRAGLLVDDRIENLTAAREHGMAVVHFADHAVEGSPYRRVGSLFELFNRGRVST